MGKRPGIDLNTAQILASMGAAVTGAILTSYLGNGGTMVGTAVGAGVSTAGFAIYKHYLVRTKEKVAPVIVQHARHWGPVAGAHTSGKRTAPGAKGAQDTPARTVPPEPGRRQRSRYLRRIPWRPGRRGIRGSDPAPERLGPRRVPGRRPHRPRRAGGHRGRLPAGTVRTGSTGNSSTGNEGPGGPNAAGGPGNPGGIVGGPGVPNGPGTHGKLDDGAGGARRAGGGLRGRPRWVVMVSSAAAVFLVATLAITLIELGTGKPLDSSLWDRKGSGTTLGNVTGGGNSNSNSNTVTPTGNPTPTLSATPGGVGQTEPQPTSSPTAAPTPSSVPSVSTVPSQNARASVAPTAPAQATPPPLPPSQYVPSQNVQAQ